ncbi:hypothetical protein AGMMS50262_10840 [Bacteroidia bacterium]|nr:hypothetical protein AGMMS50262_10840 [Bacteroidia bacterium]
MNAVKDIDYDSIRKTTAEIIAGSRQICRLISEGENGRIAGGIRNVEASCVIGTEKDTDLSDTSEQQSLIQENLLENYAKNEGIWFEYSEIKTVWNRIDIKQSTEAEIYEDENQAYIRKVFYYLNSDTPLEFLDNRISLHNALFPETKYELIGFTKSIKGFAFILKQLFIIGRETTKEDNLDSFMLRMGFEKTGFNCFQNGIIEIADLHGGNVLKGIDGNFYFIDTIPRLLDNDIYTNFIIR